MNVLRYLAASGALIATASFAFADIAPPPPPPPPPPPEANGAALLVGLLLTAAVIAVGFWLFSRRKPVRQLVG